MRKYILGNGVGCGLSWDDRVAGISDIVQRIVHMQTARVSARDTQPPLQSACALLVVIYSPHAHRYAQC